MRREQARLALRARLLIAMKASMQLSVLVGKLPQTRLRLVHFGVGLGHWLVRGQSRLGEQAADSMVVGEGAVELDQLRVIRRGDVDAELVVICQLLGRVRLQRGALGGAANPRRLLDRDQLLVGELLQQILHQRLAGPLEAANLADPALQAQRVHGQLEGYIAESEQE